MKKLILAISILMISTKAFAGSITLNFPDGENTRILNGITKNGAACNQGEALGACAKRLLINLIKHEVTTWDDYLAKKAATDAVTPAVDPSVS